MPTRLGRTEFDHADKTQLYSQKELNVKSRSSEDLKPKGKTGLGSPTRSVPVLSLSTRINPNFGKNRFNRQSFPKTQFGESVVNGAH